MSVHALSLSKEHTFTKQRVSSLTLLENLGVEGDCHCGATVQHRSRLKIRPIPPNLRQVHLIDLEILNEMNLKPGDIGENISTVGMDLLKLGTGTKLHFLPEDAMENVEEEELAKKDDHPVLVVTGLRNPCPQISHFSSGLQECFIERDADRKIVGRKAGVMTTVEVGGAVELGMRIIIEKPSVWEALQCV
jgi:MOSC domain-containing protein YiiM